MPRKHVKVFEHHRDNILRIKQNAASISMHRQKRGLQTHFELAIYFEHELAQRGRPAGGRLLSVLPPGVVEPSASSVAEDWVWMR